MSFLAHLAGSEIVRFVVKLAPYGRVLRYKVWAREQRVRVSFSALLLIQKENRYALIRTLHRPEAFGPIGGVFKHGHEVDDLLQGCEFECQYNGTEQFVEMKNDLRGFVPGRCLFKVLRWFEHGVGRESATDCLAREIREELSEIECPHVPPPLKAMNLKYIRTVLEGPTVIHSHAYHQFRVYEIFRLVADGDPAIQRFIDQLFEFSKTSSDLTFVTAEDIRLGRTELKSFGNRQLRHAIGHHAEFLLRPKAMRPDEPQLRLQ